MKKSIFKKLVSVVSVLAMTVTCTATAFAAYECASQESDLSNATNWKAGGSVTGCVQSIKDGVLTSNATIRYVNGGWNKADGEGGWTSASERQNIKSTYTFANSQTFTKGKIQAKFDFKLSGAAGQCITIGLQGSTDAEGQYVGIRILGDNMRYLYPSGQASNQYWYDTSEAHTPLTAGVWYTATIVYDIDTKMMQFKMTGNGVNYSSSESITGTDSGGVNDKWKGRTEGAISGLAFVSERYVDNFGTGTDSTPGASVWHIDNVELDAGIGYAMEPVYTSGDGVVSNAAGTGINFDGVKFSALTRIAAPTNTRFITATYDGDNRMVSADVKPLADVLGTMIDPAELDATAKSFVFDMDTAVPYMAACDYEFAAPEKTVRKIDFDSNNFVLTRINDDNQGIYGLGVKGLAAEKVHGSNADGVDAAWTGTAMSVVTENGNKVLKSERARWANTANSSQAFRFNKDTATFAVLGSAPYHCGYYVRLGKTVSTLKGSLKFKFNGSSFESGYQEIQINMGTGDAAATDNQIRIRRSANGNGQIREKGGNVMNWTVDEYMRTDEWYTLDFTYTGSKLTGTVSGNFGKDTKTYLTKSFNLNVSGVPTSFDYVGIVSHRAWDYIASYASVMTDKTAVATSETTNTSIWYIDDIVFKY